MIKKALLMLLAVLAVACGGHKSVAKHSRPQTKKSAPVARRAVTKKTAGKTAAAKPQTQNKREIERNYETAKEYDKSSPNSEVYSKSEILEATTRVKVTTAMVYDYINQYKEIAKRNMSQYGIPASIILGQGILESGAGTGPLSMLANNHFGIKCHKEWTGASVRYDDDEAQECFRKYDQPSESYQDHSLFLTSRSRYASLFTLDKDDYKAWARGLRSAGYATDPKYPEKLIGIIERYQLNQYDAEVLGTKFVPSDDVAVVTNEPAAIDPDTYQVVQGDTLYSISKRFNITVEELRRKNNMTDNAISIGQNLKIK
jgi:flagellum-specific peptidoglycan hydrolase FlgJ